MKKALIYLFRFILISTFILNMGLIEAYAQPSCEISIDKPMPVCPNSKFELSVEEGEGLVYLWQPGGETTSSILVKITDTTEYIVRVTDTINFEECESDPFVVPVYPLIEIEFEQLQLTCTQTFLDDANAEDKTQTAIVKATASGAFESDEYEYIWEVLPKQIAPGDSSTALGLKAHLTYNIKIKDNYGCALDTGFKTKAYDNPIAEISADPDTAYIQKPFIDFYFENLSADSIDITNHFWQFEIGDPFYADSIIESDLLEPKQITYPTIGIWPVYLTVYNPQGCDTLYTHEVEVKPVKLFIPNVFTPRPASPDMNDFFQIVQDEDTKNPDIHISTFYKSSILVVFNRWGNKVYESNDYRNDWDGGDLPSGVYYYVLKCEGYKSNDVFKGAVTIVRSGEQNN